MHTHVQPFPFPKNTLGVAVTLLAPLGSFSAQKPTRGKRNLVMYMADLFSRLQHNKWHRLSHMNFQAHWHAAMPFKGHGSAFIKALGLVVLCQPRVLISKYCVEQPKLL
eukprot:1150692-Pelagomonas_calceolata.AAC.7